MRFFYMRSTDYYLLHHYAKRISGVIWLAHRGWLRGEGPDCYYVYERLVAAEEMPPRLECFSDLVAQVGLDECRAVCIEEITAERALALMGEYRPCYPDAEDLPECLREWALTRPESYKTWDGGRSMGRANRELIERLAALPPGAGIPA